MSEDLALEALLDFLDAIEAGVISAKQRIKEAKIPDEDFDKLRWGTKEGTKAEYEQTTKMASNNSVLFQTLQQKLKEHNGFCQNSGYKYWFHQDDNNIIDRRKA